MRDVDVSTIGMQYKPLVQPPPNVACVFALATCQKQHKKQHAKLQSRDAGAVCLSGIGQDSRWRPLTVHRLVFCSKEMLASVLRPLVFASFAAQIGPSCSANAHCHVLSTADGSHSAPRSLFSSRSETAPHSVR